MKKPLLKNYIIKQLVSVEKQLRAYTKDKKPSRLHHLRVSIKKIKAIISFAEFAYEENYRIKKLLPLFHHAGEIREIQINIHLLNSLPIAPKFIISQLKKKKEILVTKQFLNNTPKYIKSIIRFKNNENLPETIPDKISINKYFKRQEHKAKKNFRKKSRKGAHKFRIIIKRMLYVYNILPYKIRKSIPLKKTKLYKKQYKLGQWHDLYSGIDFISRQRFPKKLIEFISVLKEKEIKQFDRIFK